MRQFLFLLGLSLLAPALMPAEAQRTPEARILLVDFDRVFRESEVGKNVIAQLQSYQVDVQRRYRDLAEQLQTQQQELKARADAKLVSQDVLQEQAVKLSRDQRLAERELENLASQGNTAFEQARTEIERIYRPIVKNIMDDRKATMVLPKQIVQHHISGLDVTTEVIDKLNEEIASFELALPERSSADGGN